MSLASNRKVIRQFDGNPKGREPNHQGRGRLQRPKGTVRISDGCSLPCVINGSNPHTIRGGRCSARVTTRSDKEQRPAPHRSTKFSSLVSISARCSESGRLYTSPRPGGEGGIRTLDTLLGYGALAKRCFQPLSHLTKNRLREYREEMWIANTDLSSRARDVIGDVDCRYPKCGRKYRRG